jgi:hypothetical protein
LALAADSEFRKMSYETEPAGYEKAVLSELQGAWQVLRDEVAEQAGFPGRCHAIIVYGLDAHGESFRSVSP